MNKVWQEHERQFIRDNANTMKDRELAAKLSKITGRNVTVQAVRKQRQKLGIQKVQGRGLCAVVQDEEKASSKSSKAPKTQAIQRQLKRETSQRE